MTEQIISLGSRWKMISGEILIEILDACQAQDPYIKIMYSHFIIESKIIRTFYGRRFQ